MAKKTKKPQVGVPEVKDSRLPLILSVLAVIVVLAGAAAAIGASRGGDDSQDASGTSVLEWQPVTVNGSPLPPAADQSGAANEAVGAQAPEIVGKTFTGEDVRISADGRKKAVMFWAHWCPHCRNELPELAPWIADNQDAYDIDYYSIATSTDPTRANFPPSEWMEDEEYPLPVMADSRQNTAANAFGLTSYPYMVFLDGQNKVVTRTSGEIGAGAFESLVQRTVAAP